MLPLTFVFAVLDTTPALLAPSVAPTTRWGALLFGMISGWDRGSIMFDAVLLQGIGGQRTAVARVCRPTIPSESRRLGRNAPPEGAYFVRGLC